MTPYVAEEFTPAEADILRRYFTNLDQPVFALTNLPEVVKGALFARYSRSPKSLRRLFLDEFVGDLDVSGDETIDATVGLRRAEELYDRVFLQYGDDSVAQLGGVHLACEQASNLLTKVLERGRLMSYLEQSTRYIAYDRRLGGRYRYHRDPDILSSVLGTRYVGDMDRLFDTYSELVPRVRDHFTATIPRGPEDGELAYRQAIAAKALDTVRGVLPAASLSNVGIYGSGQGYENLLIRMRAHPLPEARAYADLMLRELRKVIPSFLTRVDLDDRGMARSRHLAATREAVGDLAEELIDPAAHPAPSSTTDVELLDHDPDAEVKLVASILYPHVDLSDRELHQQVERLTVDERVKVLRAAVGRREDRRHRPGRAFERPAYRFDVLADYGAFRDLQRHRMLTIEWQELSPRHGYVKPVEVDEAGGGRSFDEAMERSAALHDLLSAHFPVQSSYAVALAYRIRFSMQMNAREAMHVLELRTTPQGHPAYRDICQRMHRLIGEQAGHRAIAEAMRFVDHGAGPPLGRLHEVGAQDRRGPGRIDAP